MNDELKHSISIIIPAKNESESLKTLLPELIRYYPNDEIIVINDGSVDETEALCKSCNVVQIIQPYSMGNGAAIKAGARKAKGDVLVLMDADGQHQPRDIILLLEELHKGYDMVVGSRTNSSQASVARLCANTLYNWLASFVTGQKIPDLTSGFRAVKADYFRKFLYLYPNGFSYPTTCTMAFFRSGYSVGYVPIEAKQRIGKSHIRLIRDGYRFLLILFKIGTLYSPLKIFVPISLVFFTTGVGYYLYTYFTEARFTNMAMLLLTTSVLVFLIGLVSEQITSLVYSKAVD